MTRAPTSLPARGAPRRRAAIAACALLALAAGAASAARAADASPGQPAPAFTLRDVSGRTVSLADFRGRTVVLEWTNPGCPFVRKHYVSGNLPALQSKYAAGGVVWIAVNSTNPDHPDYLAPAALSKTLADWRGAPSAVLMDPDGTAGRAYGARTTPQMVIIDPKGQVVFNGAIDSIRSANPADIPKATNFVVQAFDEIKAGKPVSNASPAPYGCSVKYAAG
jgi:ABC-type Fe3+-hydroxamate transport system substrate-binding protein